MNNAQRIARGTLVCLFALSGIFLAAGCYVRAADMPGPTLPLQSLRELKEPAGVPTRPASSHGHSSKAAACCLWKIIICPWST